MIERLEPLISGLNPLSPVKSAPKEGRSLVPLDHLASDYFPPGEGCRLSIEVAGFLGDPSDTLKMARALFFIGNPHAPG